MDSREMNVLLLLLYIETCGDRGSLRLDHIPFDQRIDDNDVYYAKEKKYITVERHCEKDEVPNGYRILTTVTATLKGIWYFYKNKEEIEEIAEEQHRARRRSR